MKPQRGDIFREAIFKKALKTIVIIFPDINDRIIKRNKLFQEPADLKTNFFQIRKVVNNSLFSMTKIINHCNFAFSLFLVNLFQPEILISKNPGSRNFVES